MARGAFMRRPGQNVNKVATNAPYGGSQGVATLSSYPPKKTRLVAADPASVARAHGMRPASQPAPNTTGTPAPAPTPVPAPDVPVTRPKGPVPKPRPESTPSSGRVTEASGGMQAIVWLGLGLILVNALFGSNSGSLLAKVWKKPEDVAMEAPSGYLPVLGEALFLLVLIGIARVAPGMQRPIIALLIGIWLLWAIFRFPDLAKQGWTKNLGNLFAGTPLAASEPASSTSSSTSSKPAFGQPYAISLPRQGGGDYTSHPVFSVKEA